MMGFSSRFFTFIHLLILISFFHLTIARLQVQPVGCHDNERAALLQFKQSLILNHSASVYPYAYPKVAWWKQDEENSNCCSWDGIKCDEDTGHVIKLDLNSSCLYGFINSSSSLFHLVHLQWLSLADNNFNHSNIPSGITNLTRLSHLNLSFSEFSGQIPVEVLELSQLVSLDLSKNIDLELQNPSLRNLAEKLINLKELDLRWVNISSSIPHALTNLSSLTYLSLEDCILQGKLPAEIFQLPNLQVLHLDGNDHLTGYLPEFLQKSTPLKDLRLSSTAISGKIPDSIENLKSLSYFDIGGSFLSGKIPSSLVNLTKLDHLDLSNSGFSSELEASFGNLTQLSYLEISNYSFSGLNSYSLSWIGNLKKLTHLGLSSNSLTGEIPSVLMNLTQLTYLDLSHNKLAGPIPYWLMNLNKLTYLALDFNQLSGHIPIEFQNFTQLQELRFASNRFEGSIPSSIFELKNLQWLDLSSNNLSGTVDLNMFLHNLKRLDVLVLSSNKLSLLTGTTTVDSNFPKLFVLGFGSCDLSEFPYFLHNQDKLGFLDLSFNNIAGEIPGWFLNVSTNLLQYLNLSHNLLIGFEQNLFFLPWKYLTTLDLSFNKLQGPLPVPSVKTFGYLVSNNQLTGEFPNWICGLNDLHVLDLSHNNLSGMLPECSGNFSNKLFYLNLQGNNFHGNIPKTFMKGNNLEFLDLSNNLLQGRIPKSMGNCVKLKFLNLGNNHITDSLPSWLGTLPELEVLILKFNRFHGVIKEPKMNSEFSKLRIIDFSHNGFTGNLPSKFFQFCDAMKDISASKLTYLQDALSWPPLYNFSLTFSNKGIEMEYQKVSNLFIAINLSNNKFLGAIPTSISYLKGLRTLNLSNNNLKGHIPSSLSNLTSLESVDLSYNELSGEIPPQLVQITTLEVFKVSHNNLRGQIPQGKQFSTFENSSFDGNPRLCGNPLSNKCEISEASWEELVQSESSSAFGWRIILMGYASGTIIGVVLGNNLSTRKIVLLAKIFGLQLKSI